jgi:AcrR family transcriptional regulator
MKKAISQREIKKQETHQRLLEVALKFFHKQGYDATTVAQITQAAGVAKGTFFNYFDTKETILPALVKWRLQQLENALTPDQGAPASPVARIKLALCLAIQDPLISPSMAKQVFAALLKQQKHGHLAHTLARILAEQVRQAQHAGEINDDLDATQLSNLICAMFFQQMLMWHQGHRPFSSLPKM